MVKGQVGRGVIKNHGTRVALSRTKPQISAKTAACRLIARSPRHTIRWAAPSQQEHRPINGPDLDTNVVTPTNGTQPHDASNS